MNSASLVFEPVEKLVYASTEELHEAMHISKSLMHCMMNAEKITPEAWKEIGEINDWMKIQLAPLLRNIIKEESIA